MTKQILCIFLTMFAFSFAEEDFDNAKEEFVSEPKSGEEAAKWSEPYDKTYLPYGVCSEIKDFSIEKLEEMVKYYYDHKPHFYSDHYYALFSIVRVTYSVTCKNKLQYKGKQYLFSDRKLLKDDVFLSKAERDEFKAHAHGWKEKPLSYLDGNGIFFDSVSDFRFKNYDKFNRDSLNSAWIRQKVSYPEWKYTGIPGKKLAKPVLFVHGLGSDYEVWGVEADIPKGTKKNKGDVNFQKGLVKKYLNGSAPDILARTQNIDNTEESINHNGIYFFQAPGYDSAKTWIEGTPLWVDPHSQSKALYTKLQEILDDFCKDSELDWRNTPELEVDIVAHSQGGLVVREMLRAIWQYKESFPKGSANPANHIGKLITVNTPHFGSEMAVIDAGSLGEDFDGLREIVADLDSLDRDSTWKHTLVNAKLDMNWFEYAYTFAGVATDLYSDAVGNNNPLAIFQGFSPVVSVLGYIFGAASSWATDISLKVKGPYFGKYTAEVFVDIPGPKNYSMDMDIKTLDSASINIRKLRNRAFYLDPKSLFMQNLASGFEGNSYPLRPDGTKLTLLPLYSPSAKRFLAEMIHSISEEANKICTEQDEDKSCFATGLYFEKMAMKMAAKKDFVVDDIRDVDFNDTLLQALVDIQNKWFSSSDVLVSEYSQKFVDSSLGLDFKLEALKKYFEQPRSYLFHDALAPWEDVLHASFENSASAPLQGLDIACALDFYCDEILGSKNAELIYLNNGSVSLAGNFEIAPYFLKKGIQEISVSDESFAFSVAYKPGLGSIVSWRQGNTSASDTLLSGSIATSPTVSRYGDTLRAEFRNFSGKTFSQDYAFGNLPQILSYSIKSDKGTFPRVVAGLANVVDLSSQTPPETPKNSLFVKSSIFAYHREARDSAEKNTSRPRILVANSSDHDIEGFKIAYYFTADPTRKPQVEIDYPKIPVSLENLGGDQWRFVLDASDSVLKAKSIFPNWDGWQIRLHYSDWTDFKHDDDWSADYNIGIPKVNRKIVIYDANGKILWGTEPEIFRTEDGGVIPVAKGTLAWTDAAPWEINFFKPKVLVKNTGAVSFKNYHAKLWFRVPEGKELNIPADDWYTPVSKPSLKNISANVWELDLFFNKYILYPGESVEEGNVGLHLMDWSLFDKTVCGIALTDSEGNVLFGKVPSVEECKSYDGPKLLTEFAWGGDER